MAGPRHGGQSKHKGGSRLWLARLGLMLMDDSTWQGCRAARLGMQGLCVEEMIPESMQDYALDSGHTLATCFSKRG